MDGSSDFHFWRAMALLDDDRHTEALSHIEAAIESDPGCADTLTLAGDILAIYSEELGLSPDLAYTRALAYYGGALAIEPRHADAWSGKALALLYAGRADEALSAAEKGLAVLPLGVGYGMTHADVRTNVTEALFDRKIRALLALNRQREARDALADGLEQCPGSEYLSRHVDHFVQPDELGPSKD